MELTQEQIISELLLCKRDPLYFIEKYINIDLPGGEVVIPIYGKQKEVVNLVYKEHFVIILKSRQIGISTIVQAFCTYVLTFYTNLTIGVISKDGAEATDFVRKTRNMLRLLPEFMQPSKFLNDNRQSFELSTKSRMLSAAVSLSNPGGVFRSKSISLLIIDEAAHIQKISEAYTALAFSLATAQQFAKQNGLPYGVIILSTPNGVTGTGEWFYKMWVDSLAGKTAFRPVVIHYKDAPFATNEWVNTQKKLVNNDPVRISQELELQFVMARDSLFDSFEVSEAIQKTIDPIRVIDRTYFDDVTNSSVDLTKVSKGQWRIFEDFDPDKYYIIGVDIASSTGICESAIVITDSNLVQVAEYSGKLRITDFEDEIIFAASELYPNSLLIVESNYGKQLVERLANNPLVAAQMYFTDHFNKEHKLVSRTPGFDTTRSTRPEVIKQLYWAVTENPDRIKSMRLAQEIVSIRKDFRSNDLSDLAICYGFIAYVAKFEPFKIRQELDEEQRDTLNEMYDLFDDEEPSDDSVPQFDSLEDEIIDWFKT
ncbi:MAG: terminase family protein [Conexivisphaerales archaeon]